MILLNLKEIHVYIYLQHSVKLCIFMSLIQFSFCFLLLITSLLLSTCTCLLLVLGSSTSWHDMLCHEQSRPLFCFAFNFRTAQSNSSYFYAVSFSPWGYWAMNLTASGQIYGGVHTSLCNMTHRTDIRYFLHTTMKIPTKSLRYDKIK